MGNKPLFLLPFIWVYHLVLIPIRFLKYFSVGLYISNIVVIELILTIVSYLFKYGGQGFIVLSYGIYECLKLILRKFPVYIIKGFTVVCYIVYQIFYITIFKIPVYVAIGLAFIFFAIRSLFVAFGHGAYNLFIKVFEALYGNVENRNDKKKREKEKKHEKEELRKEAKRKKHERDVFINDKVVIEKKSFGRKVKDFILSIINLPKKFGEALKSRYNNSSVIRSMKNRKDINREALLINFDGEEAEKSETKILYEYEARDEAGKMVKGYFEAFSKVEVHSFLLSEGLTVYSIRTNKWITMMHQNDVATKTKIKNKDLIFFLTQLSTYLKAGITLVDALKILSRQYKNKKYQRIFRTIVYDLTVGESFSTALDKQGAAFPRLLINMVKTSEMTGELPEVLDDMADHFSKIEKTKKEMVNALMYPCLVFVFAIGVIIFIMLFVIPKFVEIYESMDSSAIPAFTLFIMSLSAFLQKNIIYIIIGTIVLILVIIQMYKRIRTFRLVLQWIGMHMPAFGNVIIYNEVTMFTKTLSSLLKHNVFITDSMDILNKMTNNEIYKTLIVNTIANLGAGDKISDAFKGQWAFPVPAYEMLVTGEKTGELAEMMEKVAGYYQTLQESSVARIKTFIEPILIVFLTTVVGAIVLAIIIPMFNMYSAIQ